MKLNIFLLLVVGLFGAACERHSASTLPGHGGHAAPQAAKDTPKEDSKPAQTKPAPSNAPAPKFFEEAGKK